MVRAWRQRAGIPPRTCRGLAMNAQLPRVVSPATAELRKDVARLDRELAKVQRRLILITAHLQALSAQQAKLLRGQIAKLGEDDKAALSALTPKPSRIRDIVQAVALETGISASDIMGRGKTSTVCEARFRVYAEANDAGLSYARIGRAMGRDHSTVMAGAKRYRAMQEQGGRQ